MINPNLKLGSNVNISQITTNNTRILFYAQITPFIVAFNIYKYHLRPECFEIPLFILLVFLIINFIEYLNLNIIFTHKYGFPHVGIHQTEFDACGEYE